MTPEQLKKHRADLNLTQSDLAVALCVTRRAVVSWETGTRNMPLCAEKLFCLLYGIPFTPPSASAALDERHPDLFNLDDY
jgi:DNA-binding transcriptional regulator YiaG